MTRLSSNNQYSPIQKVHTGEHAIPSSTYCLLQWQSCRAAVHSKFISSILHRDDFLNSPSALDESLSIYALNKQFHVDQHSRKSYKNIVVIAANNVRFGLYCEAIDFNDGSSAFFKHPIPPAMNTSTLPFTSILYYKENNYLEIDPLNLYRALYRDLSNIKKQKLVSH